eukprot:2454550-Amphidinium_carterae.1
MFKSFGKVCVQRFVPQLDHGDEAQLASRLLQHRHQTGSSHDARTQKNATLRDLVDIVLPPSLCRTWVSVNHRCRNQTISSSTWMVAGADGLRATLQLAHTSRWQQAKRPSDLKSATKLQEGSPSTHARSLAVLAWPQPPRLARPAPQDSAQKTTRSGWGSLKPPTAHDMTIRRGRGSLIQATL